MTGVYDLRLVALSLIVAIIASYTGLQLGGRVRQHRGKSAWQWLVGGAVSMGIGIWSMHSIGMLAFSLPIAVAYDIAGSMLSMLIAIVASGLALAVVRRPTLTTLNLAGSAALMGGGISAMHYTGMHAMRMSPAIQYEPSQFTASIVIAMVASLAALWSTFQLRQQNFGGAVLAKLGGATVMGLAITGMHYTGMAAATFAAGSICMATDATGGMSSEAMALTIGIAAICILVITLGAAAFDAHVAVLAGNRESLLQTANDQLRNLALYDSLTGLPNRMLLDDRVLQTAAHAERGGSSFAVMFVDLDRFKPVNDTFGHDVGDGLLKAVAQRLIGCVRTADTVARTGGDEFVILLNEIRNSNDAAAVGEKILAELSRPFFIAGNELDISGSIGISVYPGDGRDVSLLKVNADMAMYSVKRNGRNSYRFFTPEMRSAARRDET